MGLVVVVSNSVNVSISSGSIVLLVTVIVDEVVAVIVVAVVEVLVSLFQNKNLLYINTFMWLCYKLIWPFLLQTFLPKQ